jgi:hypothetical protein
MIVVIASEPNSDFSVEDTILNRSYCIAYNSHLTVDSDLTIYQHLTLAGIRLQEILLFETEHMLDAVTTPVLVILDNSFEFDKFTNKQISTDTIFFDSLQDNIKPTAIYGSIVSVTKVLRSANKLQFLLKDNNAVVKFPFLGPCHELFQLLWYSVKIGLKVYEAK